MKVSRVKIRDIRQYDTVRIKGCERQYSPVKEMKQVFDTTVTGLEVYHDGTYILHTTAGVLQPKKGNHFIFKVEGIKLELPSFPKLNFGRERAKTFKGKSIE